MFTPEPVKGFICLRCQTRFARRQVQRHNRSFFQSSKPIHQDVQFAPAEASTPVPSAPRTHARQTPRPAFRRLSLHDYGGKRPEDRTETLPIKSLGTDSEVIILAERDKKLPKGFGTRDQSTHRHQGVQERISSGDIVRSVQAGRTVPSQEEVNRLIEAIAGDFPLFVGSTSQKGGYDEVTVSRSVFDEKATTLYNWFSYDQLWRYITARQDIEQLERLKRSENHDARQPTEFPDHRNKLSTINRSGNGGPFLSRSQWRPGTSPIDARLPDETKGPWYDKALKGKKALVDRLLRVHSRLNVEEEIMTPGELELTMDPRSLSTLLSGEPSQLQKIATDHNAKIEVYRPENVVRIAANRGLCIVVEAAIRAKLFAVSTEDVDLQPVQELIHRRGGIPQPELFRSRDLKEVEQITGTSLKVVQTSTMHLLRIHHESWESAADARRLALALVNLPSKGIDDLLAKARTRISGILRPIGRIVDLPYRYRRRAFGRWLLASSKIQTEMDTHEDTARHAGNRRRESTPSSESQEGEERAEYILQKRAEHILQKQIYDLLSTTPKNLPAPEQISSAFEAGARLGSQFSASDYVPKSTLNVAFGHILHEPIEEVPQAVTFAALSEQAHFSRAFSTALPGLRLLLPQLNQRFDTPKDSLCIRLTPPPWKATQIKDFEQFPDLEIYCSLDQLTQQLSSSAMRLIYPPTVASVMLPSQAVDLRFMRTESIWVSKAFEIPAVQQFVAEVKASVAGQGTIRAPTWLKGIRAPIRKPTPTTGRKGKKQSDDVKNEEKDTEGAEWRFEPMDFSFAGLEYSQQTTFAYKDYKVFYTNYEAGQMGGRRGELKMQMPSVEPPRTTNSWREDVSLNPALDGLGNGEAEKAVPVSEEFIKTAFELADLVTRGVQGKFLGSRTVAGRQDPPPHTRSVTLEGQVDNQDDLPSNKMGHQA